MTSSRKAIHEIGHVVPALNFGHGVTAVRLLPTGAGPYDGVMEHLESLMDIDPDEFVVVALAGKVAEQLLCNVADDDYALAVGASEDIRRVRELLAAIHLDAAAADAHFARAARLAAHLVLVHAPLIRKIAAVLDRQRALTAEQVRALIIEHHTEATR